MNSNSDEDDEDIPPVSLESEDNSSINSSDIPPSLALDHPGRIANNMSELVSLDPSRVYAHIQFLENRVAQMANYCHELQVENVRVCDLLAETRRSNRARTPEASVFLFQVPTENGTSTHEVSAQPRFGFPPVPSMSLTDARLSSRNIHVDLPSTPTSTAISSPALRVMYLRRGVDLNQSHPSISCPSASSHQLVTLQEPSAFVQDQPSDMSFSDDDVSEEHSIMSDDTRSMCTQSFNLHEREVTTSLPIIKTFPSIPDFSDEDDESHHSNDEQQAKLGLSHSWPSYHQRYLRDFTLYLSEYLDDDTDSEYDYDGRVPEFQETASQEYVTPRTSGSSMEVEVNSQTSGYTHSESAPESLNVTQEDEESLAENPRSEEGTQNFPDVVEHPFVGLHRRFHEEVAAIRTLFGPAIPGNPNLTTPSGVVLSRRRSITTLSIPYERGISSWARTLRGQIFLNINIGERRALEPIPEVDELGTDSADTIHSATDSSEDSFQEPEHNDGDGEQIEGDDIALGPDIDEPQEDDEAENIVASSSSSENSGRGDAASASSSSSLESRTAGFPSPSGFPYPSESNLGGKYGYLNSAIRRPRAPAGHRFVISVFGTTSRRDNESNLPSWVPVYAERLQCILNQFLENDDTYSVFQALNKSSKSAHSYRSVVTCTESQENRLKKSGSLLKSCLKLSRARVPKNLSWSKRIIVKDVETSVSLPSASVEENEMKDQEGKEAKLKSGLKKTKSCPDVLLQSSEATEAPRKPVIQFKNNIAKIRSKKKWQPSRIIGKLLCNCSNTLKKSPSSD